MMRVFHFLSAFIAVIVLSGIDVTAETTEKNGEYKLHVYHKQGADYKKRGEIVGLPNSPTYIATTTTTTNDVDETIELTSPLYQIKIRDENTDRIILSSIKACQLVNSGWKEEFRVHLDDEKRVYHVDYYAQSDACTSSSNIELPYKVQPKFTSNVIIERPVPGAKPFLGQFGSKSSSTQQQQPRQQQQQQQGQQGQGGDDELPIEEEKTFFQKYWYLVLGGVLLLINSMNAPPESNAAPRR